MNDKINKMKRLLSVFLIVLCIVTGCRAEPSVEPSDTGNAIDGKLEVHFLDVGQGNAVLVENQGEFMLIDGGDRDYSSFVVKYLMDQGVKRLKYTVVSHYDSDHLNGIVGALNKFACDLILDPDYQTDSKIYQSFQKVISERKIEVEHPSPGEQYTLGDAGFTVVCPADYDFADENDNSVGILLEHGKNRFLICGDAGFQSEEDMLESGEDLKCDVYLASHHGSKSSSGEEFLDEAAPSYIVVSCGKGNSYGHPAEEFLERAKATDAQLLRTDLQGTLIAQSDGKTITWNQAPVNDWRSQDEIENGEKEEKTQEKMMDGKETQHFVLNTRSKKIHLPDCSSVASMSEKNKREADKTVKELEKDGYELCEICRDRVAGE